MVGYYELLTYLSIAYETVVGVLMVVLSTVYIDKLILPSHPYILLICNFVSSV